MDIIKKTNLISIITPTYNHEKYIGECIKSVIAQSYQNWELIIVNDGSTDKTYEIAQEYKNKDKRIILINQVNKGIFKLSETYNKALSIAKGDYIAILEGDDFWVPNKLKIQLEVMQNNKNIVLCWGMAQSFFTHKNNLLKVYPINIKKNKIYYNNNPVGSFFNMIFDDFPAPLTFLIRKTILEEIGGFKQVYPFPAVDLPTILELSIKGEFYFCSDVLGYWRIHKNQITKNHSIEIIKGSENVVKSHFDKLHLEVRRCIIFDKDKISKKYINAKIISYSRNGRINLVNRKFREARISYIKSIFISYPWINFMWKVRSLIGLFASFIKIDIEWLAKLLKKPNYK